MYSLIPESFANNEDIRCAFDDHINIIPNKEKNFQNKCLNNLKILVYNFFDI